MINPKFLHKIEDNLHVSYITQSLHTNRTKAINQIDQVAKVKICTFFKCKHRLTQFYISRHVIPHLRSLYTNTF